MDESKANGNLKKIELTDDNLYKLEEGVSVVFIERKAVPSFAVSIYNSKENNCIVKQLDKDVFDFMINIFGEEGK